MAMNTVLGTMTILAKIEHARQNLNTEDHWQLDKAVAAYIVQLGERCGWDATTTVDDFRRFINNQAFGE
jgi:hypothetical protein